MKFSALRAAAVLTMGVTFRIFAQNLIANGGFESGAAGWNLYLQTGFTGTVTYPTAGAPEGTAYAQVHITQVTVADPNADNWKAQFQLPQWTTAKNDIYRLAFKARSTVKQLKVGINRGGSGDYVGGYDIPLDTVWQTNTCMFIGDTSGAGALRLNFYIGADTGVYEFDSVVLVKTGTATPTGNLITNGGFELEGAGWGIYIQSEAGADAAVTYPDTGAAEGSRYAGVTVAAATDASQVQLQTPLFIAEEGAIYTITYQARGDAAIRVVAQYDQTINYQVKESKFQEITAEWATYSAEFASDVAGSGALRLNFYLGGAVGTYGIDSVYVAKAATPLRPSPSGKGTAPKDLIVRKADRGLLITLPRSAAQGVYSLALYSLSGRLIDRMTGMGNNSAPIPFPPHHTRGAFLLVYSDQNRNSVVQSCLSR
jgi:hypothetical protein